MVTELYGGGLEPDRRAGREDAGPELLDRFVADDLVASLLLVHGLHPEGLADRVERRWLGSGRCSPRTAATSSCSTWTRTRGPCGCGCSAAATAARRRRRTLQRAVEAAIDEAAPEIGDHRRRATRRGGGGDRGVRARAALGRKPVFDTPPRPKPAQRDGRAMTGGPAGCPAADPHVSSGAVPPGRRGVASCARAHPRRARPPRRPADSAPHVRVPGLLSPLHRRRPAGGDSASVPDRYRAFPDFALSPGAVGRLADPGGRGLLLRQLHRSSACAAFYPGPPARPSPSCRSRRGRRSSTANPARVTLQPDVEAFLVRTRRPGGATPGAECFLVPIDRVLRAGRATPNDLAGLRRRHGGARRDRRFFDRVRRPRTR